MNTFLQYYEGKKRGHNLSILPFAFFFVSNSLFLFQVKFCDVILCNRYYAWYHDYGQTQLISKQLERELRGWFDAYGKPVIQAEYGADTVAGMHVVRAT